MSTRDTERLLRAYVEEGCESAFREIVTRYIDLVYSVAFRRTSGETQLAQETVQRVFIDLSRKAHKLSFDVALGGWLHRHACFVAGTVARSEARRRRREQEAVAMEVLEPEADASWTEIAPALDNAVNGLSDPDRTAVLLRFFEQQDFRTIGQALAISEDAAQKRVSRALDKLRDALGKAGIVLSTATLSTLLTANAIICAPTGTLASVTHGVATAATVGITTSFLKLFSSAMLKKAAVALLATAVVILVTLRSDRNPADQTNAQENRVQTTEQPMTQLSNAEAMGSMESEPPVVAIGKPPELQLRIVADDSGKPVPNVAVDFRRWEKKAFQKGLFQSTRAGVCAVTFPRDATTQLELITRVEGFGDTRLRWQTERGDIIPTNYTVRLVRAVPIGGRVLDADGQPVADARVGFNHDEDPREDGQIESHEFGWIQVMTDGDGRWSINRLAPEMVRRLYGAARHPEHVDAKFLQLREDNEAEQQLKAGTHVFHFGRPVSIPGMVVDAAGNPITGASILVGQHDETSSRKATSGDDGSFTVKGCKPGLNAVSAEAPGFSVTTVNISASPEMEPLRLLMQPGRLLRLRVVYADGQLATNVPIIYENMGQRSIEKERTTQAKYEAQTDVRGEAVWSNAPPGQLSFTVLGKDSMALREATVEAKETEHTFQLSPALVVTGKVRDADTGEPIERYRIVCGWPESDFIRGGHTPKWSSLSRHWLNFSRPEFRHVFSEALLIAKTNYGYVLKFEAEGYAAFVSRVIAADEGAAHLDVRMSKGRETLLTVEMPDGRPAQGAEVGLVSPGAQLELSPGGFSGQTARNGSVLRTDARGQVRFPADATVTRLFICHDDGCADLSLETVERQPVVRLSSWGRVTGRFYREGKPAEGAELIVSFLQTPTDRSLTFGFGNFKTEVDKAGRYTFNKLPPGELNLIHLVPGAGSFPGGKSWTHSQLGTFSVRPGETTTKDIGVNVKRVIARVQWPAEFASENLRKLVFLNTPGPEAPDEIVADDKAYNAWVKAVPGRLALLSARRVFMLNQQADGSWTGGDLEPGNYILKARLMQFDPETKQLTPIGFGRKFDVSIAEETDAIVDMGTLNVVASATLLSRSEQ